MKANELTQPEESLKIVNCQDCFTFDVVVKESHFGNAYCTECITLERLKETEPELYNEAMKAII